MLADLRIAVPGGIPIQDEVGPMNRRTSVCLLGFLALLAACQNDAGLSPSTVDLPGGLMNPLIADGNHSAGNRDFFFLEPMVADPRKTQYFNKGQFNAKLKPEVLICTKVGDVIGGNCVTADGDNVAHFSGSQITLHLENDPLNDENFWYQVDWKIPTSATTFYRVTVKVGATILGSADVKTGTKSASNTNDYAFQKDGATLPIKFRIENRALCTPAGDYSPSAAAPCASATVDLGTGGTATTTLPGGYSAGVSIPSQPGGGAVTVTVKPCLDLNAESRGINAIDLPVFGSCLTITTDPVLTSLTNPAVVSVCDAAFDLDLSSLEPSQKEQITLHQWDAGSPATVKALPEATPSCPVVVGSLGSRIKGVLAHLRQGEWKAAGRGLASLVGPQQLYAINLGGGGKVGGFSDFQFALPAKMEIVPPNPVTVAPGTVVPATVKVTDLFGAPVVGARVHFSGGTTATITTIAGGIASTPWTINLGSNQLIAKGFGIASPSSNGPRAGTDPFIPTQTGPPFGEADGPQVTVGTGQLTFTATGAYAPVTLINYGSTGYEYLTIPLDGTQPSGWQTGSGTFAAGNAAFGNSGYCPLNSDGSVKTAWSGSEILIRRSFTAPYGGTITVGVAIDNDVQVFLDGVDISLGVVTHEGCPTLDSYTFTRIVSAGPHTLAIRGIDRGDQAYLDARVSLAP